MEPGALVAHRYRIERALGRGGMATSFAARDLVHDIDVSLKRLELRSRAGIEAFRQEFVLLSRLHHPRLCRVIDFLALRQARDGRGASHVYTAEYVEGTTLGSCAVGRDWSEVERPFVHALEALGHLHRAGIAHGDFKPDNVIVSPNGDGTLIDLGCAWRLDGDGRPHTVSGTREFIAPELLMGDGDARSDLFAVGVTLRVLAEKLGAALPTHVAELGLRLRQPDRGARPLDVAEVLDALGARAPPARIGGLLGTDLVSRERELGTLDLLLDGLSSGEPGTRVLWLAGERGVGRSRLLCEMRWRAELRLGVVEGNAAAPSPLASMLARVDGRELADSLPAVLERWRELGSGPAPLLFVLDDAERLGQAEQRQLAAIVRLTARESRVALVCASTDAAPEGAAALASLELAPLSAAAVRAWVGDEAQAEAIWRATGGFPDEIVALGRAQTLDHRITRLSSLPANETQLLAAIVALEGSATPTELRALGAAPDAAPLLADRGLVERAGQAWRLKRVADAPRIAQLVMPEKMTDLHRTAAALHRSELDALGPDDLARPRSLGRLCRSLVAAGEAARAAELLLSAEREALSAPQELRSVASTLLGAAAPEVTDAARLLSAELLRRAGDASIAISGLAKLLRRRPAAGTRAEIRRIAGSCYAAIGDTRRARSTLRRALAELEELNRRSSLAQGFEQLVLAELKHGDYAAALQAAAAGLEHGDDQTSSALHAGAGVAASYLGDFATARVHLDRVAPVDGAGVDPRALVRTESARALMAYREGHTREAREAYARAHASARQARLDDLIAPTALNHGVACHQAGDWGAALAAYEEGLDVAVALHMPSTEVTLLVNLAKLHSEIGLVHRAEARATLAAGRAAQHGLCFLGAASACVAAEIAVARGDGPLAQRELERARAVFSEEGAQRELLEVEIDLARLEAEENPRAGLARLTLVAARVERTEARDLLARLRLAQGLAHARAGDLARALSGFEQAEELGRDAEQLPLQAEAAARAAWATRRAGLVALARRHSERAREHAERIALTLPAELREPFFRHPLRALLESASDARGSQGQDGPRLRHLLDINRRLNSALTTQEVLDASMDSAIELSGAERGFLILAAASDDRRSVLRVPVARNVDRERIGKSHLKFSRGIAERVVTTGEVVVTVDAVSDARFRSNRSVHAMRLKSVMVVPIRAPDRVLGAIYLDNRFRSEGFSEGHVELVLALADQAAIALARADLHDQLAVRTRELELERLRVEELLVGQRLEIERLSSELDVSRSSPAGHYAYPEIIGKSLAMRRLFSTVDRVVSTELTILIRGESGTGKELVARALHVHGPRADRPLVAVNCGALPDQLLEAELFGYRKGAFTGAVCDHPGLFVMAEGGTLFLDELGEMSTSMQVKLLRALQEREVRPLGSDQARPVDVRVLAATNRDLRSEIEAGRFREDLYYRVAVVELVLPPLRERLEDLPLLAAAILARAAERAGRAAVALSPLGLRALASHTWPGNVRELENVLTKAAVLFEADVIGPEHLEIDSVAGGQRSRRRRGKDVSGGEASEMQRALDAHGWNACEAARALGMSRATFYRRLKSYGLERPPL